MGSFGIYPNSEGEGYLLDVQSQMLRHLNSRVVVPLLPVGHAPKAATRLNPTFIVDELEHVMVTQFMAAVPASLLKREITNVADRRSEIVNALDLLLHGS